MAKGWRNESLRHQMSAYGIKSGTRGIPELKLRSNRLPVQIGLVVPSTDFDKKLPQKEYQKRVQAEKKYFSGLFGGETAITSQGGYIAQEKVNKRNKNKLIEEEGTIVQASTTPEIYEKHKDKIASHIKSRQKEWKQQTIGYSLEGDFYVYPRKSFIASSKSKNIILE